MWYSLVSTYHNRLKSKDLLTRGAVFLLVLDAGSTQVSTCFSLDIALPSLSGTSYMNFKPKIQASPTDISVKLVPSNVCSSLTCKPNGLASNAPTCSLCPSSILQLIRGPITSVLYVTLWNSSHFIPKAFFCLRVPKCFVCVSLASLLHPPLLKFARSVHDILQNSFCCILYKRMYLVEFSPLRPHQ